VASAGGDWKALYEAAKNGAEAEVRSWLATGIDPDLQHLEYGTTPLIAAAERGHLAVVRALVSGGADPSVRSEWDGYTAREAAQQLGHGDVVRWLAEQEKSSS
jgi:ankyrin repeat protein